jgi:hypothetical protein
MTPGSSRELFVYALDSGATAGCASTGGGRWIYGSSRAGQMVELRMPDHVGYRLPAGGSIEISPLLINLGTQPLQPQIKLNLLRAQNLQYEAAAMLSFNTNINVPPATAAGPGTQMVNGTCSAPAGTNFFLLGTHTHRRATSADINFVSNGAPTRLVHTTSWDDPDIEVWHAPSFVTTAGSDSLSYACSYSNLGTTAITVGESDANSEMCMAIGYYFPVGSVSCR